MSKRSLSTFSLPKSSLSALARGGYETISDLSACDPESLARDLNIPIPSSQAILSATQQSRAPPATQSASAIISSASAYSTNCPPLDRLLNGGITQGNILELSGPPGTAKNIVAAEITRRFVEAAHEVLFVDMQNMMSPSILNKILSKLEDMPDGYQNMVQYLNLHTLPDLQIFLRTLPTYLDNHPKIALLVLGSLSFPFQSPSGLHNTTRNTLFDRTKGLLARLCSSKGLTIVITTQLATKLLNRDGTAANFETGSRAVMVPLLGSTYLPAGKTHRVIIVPRTRTTGILRLLSSPIHSQGHTGGEEPYTMIEGEMH